MRIEKRLTALIMACVFLMSLSACGDGEYKDSQDDTHPNNSISESIVPTETEPLTEPIKQQEKTLSCDTLMSRARNWAKEKDMSFDIVTDVETKPGKVMDETTTTFSFYGDYASASVSEINELIQTVMVVSLPSKFAEDFPSNSSVDNSQYAYVVCMELIKLCELDKDLDWHETQLKSAPEEGDSTTIIRSYASNDWYYTAIIGEYVVTCVAGRYCSQCKTNAPTVTFTSASSICDSCNSADSLQEDFTFPPSEEPEENLSMNEVPYTTSLEAVASIYAEPDSNSRFVQKVGEKGIYTIVEEAHDSSGNLWGKLKSGLGWVCLTGSVEENNVPVNGVCLEDILDTSKVWKTSFRRTGYIGTFQYTFSKDGTCYLLMSYGFEPWDGGKGTYQINGNTIKFSIVMGDTRHTYSYEFDPDTYMLTQISGKAIYSDFTAGTQLLLEEDTSNSVAKIREMAQSFMDGYNQFEGSDEDNTVDNNTPEQPTLCSHSYAEATCTEPKTCVNCGATTGSAAGHKWKAATCTEPESCTVCMATGSEALGHSMLFTKCKRSACNHTDYSCIAGTYTNIGGYGVPVGTTTMVDINVTNVSVSNFGVLCFTYNGQSYTLTIKQKNKSDDYMAYFDCYLDGERIQNVDFRAGSEAYDNRIYLDGFIADGCKIYLSATR